MAEPTLRQAIEQAALNLYAAASAHRERKATVKTFRHAVLVEVERLERATLAQPDAGEGKPLPEVPDDADPRVVLRYLRMCASSWDGNARLLGNVRACDLVRMADVYLSATPAPIPPALTAEDVTCQHGTALDVHCCHCHSGFQFDITHECPPDRSMTAEDYRVIAVLLEKQATVEWVADLAAKCRALAAAQEQGLMADEGGMRRWHKMSSRTA